jgi:hypothetical protein
LLSELLVRENCPGLEEFVVFVEVCGVDIGMVEEGQFLER